MNPADHIRRLIRDCASARDGRGRWRQERALEQTLLSLGDSPAIARATAAAARAVGECIGGGR